MLQVFLKESGCLIILQLASVIVLVIEVGSQSVSPHLSHANETSRTTLESDPQNTRIPDDGQLLAPELGAAHGYVVDSHRVKTEDGYILTVHRIPFGKGENNSTRTQRYPVLLQHGLFCSSTDWMYLNRDPPLAYLLADAGYDVWLGNSRGNTYSRRHVHYRVDSNEFWNFSWHEMGVYDLPAIIDYILMNTGSVDLFYVGHSMGTTMFFVMGSMRPEYNSKVRAMFALAPVAFESRNVTTPLKVLAPFSAQLAILLKLTGRRELPSSRAVDRLFGSRMCMSRSPVQALCSDIIFLVSGYDMAQFNQSMLPVIVGHTPAGTSYLTVAHYGQSINSGRFRQYDYGFAVNYLKYHQLQPPDYNLSRIMTPVYLYRSDNDWYSVYPDIERLASALPNMRLMYTVPYPEFGHLEFLWATDVKPLVYDSLMNDMKLAQLTEA